MIRQIAHERVAECCGLWLAEGDNKSRSEITFTNNCFELVDLFYMTMKEIFPDRQYNPRIYVYSSNGKKVTLPYKNCAVKYYLHKRATKPYFIFRIASVKMIKEWREIINQNLSKKELSPLILRGFFAGEGNVHIGKRSVRVLRISQAIKKPFINNLLDELRLKYTFEQNNRNYILSGKPNWDIFAKHKLADLHPIKRDKFWKAYKSFKEEHYPKNYLLEKIPEMAVIPITSKQLANKLSRSQARISEVLVMLKKMGKLKNFKVRSASYWTSNMDLILISRIKQGYLSFLNKSRKTYEFAKYFNVDWKSSSRRLGELDKLKLVKMEENGKWIKLLTKKQIITI